MGLHSHCKNSQIFAGTILCIKYTIGRKRKVEEYCCKFCKINNFRIKGSKKQFCSNACSNKARSNQIEMVCTFCQKVFKKAASKANLSKHGYHFCSRKCKDTAFRLDSGANIIRPSTYKTGVSLYRKQCKEELEKGCQCGEKRKYLLFIHHMDGNRQNNNKENLEIVCANCHIIRHLALVKDEWVFKSKALTPLEMIKKL